jgi:transposase
MTRLTGTADGVIGVDTHRDSLAAAVTDPVGGVLAQTSVSADAAGYQHLLAFARVQVPGRRCWAVEGASSYGAGLAGFLHARGERVVEIGRPKRPARRTGAKSDALDAVRAARQALIEDHPLSPCRRGDREAPRDRPARSLEHRMTVRVLRSTARRIQLLAAEAAELRAELERLVAAVAPWLLELPGVGPISAAQVLVSWSHAGRLRSDAAFAALAGANPIPASSGQVIRHRLNRGGGGQLNRALHTIVLARLRDDPQTRAYAARRRGEGKSIREVRRCLKRAVARQLFKLLECYSRVGVEVMYVR